MFSVFTGNALRIHFSIVHNQSHSVAVGEEIFLFIAKDALLSKRFVVAHKGKVKQLQTDEGVTRDGRIICMGQVKNYVATSP